MFEGILSFLTPSPKRSEADEKLDEALSTATQLDHYFFFLTSLTPTVLPSACKSADG